MRMSPSMGIGLNLLQSYGVPVRLYEFLDDPADPVRGCLANPLGILDGSAACVDLNLQVEVDHWPSITKPRAAGGPGRGAGSFILDPRHWHVAKRLVHRRQDGAYIGACDAVGDGANKTRANPVQIRQRPFLSRALR